VPDGPGSDPPASERGVSELITFGELLIDFVPTVTGVSLMDAPAFVKAAGGATANVAVGAARLGVSVGFMGKVGDDAFGHFLERELRESGVDTRALCFTRDARTSLAFVTLRADGEREFIFYRESDKDMLLDFAPAEIDTPAVRSARIFHFGSISLVAEPSRWATRIAIAAARSAGVTVSYDPNLRLNVWPTAAAARDGLMLGWRQAHIVKASEEDVAFLTGTSDPDAAADRLWHDDMRLLVVTLGKNGCRYYTPAFRGEVAGFAVTAVDTTGAGDGFTAGLLFGLTRQYGTRAELAQGDAQAVAGHARFGCLVGSRVVTRLGAVAGLPTLRQLGPGPR
jgi:fructokinase